MLIRIDTSAVSRTKKHEYVIRFVFGGFITAMAGLIAARFGPVTAGLFLAFPAIFPASATLVGKHEREEKRQIGLHGGRRAIYTTADDAMGTAIGSSALLAFALTCWLLLPRYSSGLVLVGATTIWATSAVSMWMFRKRYVNRISKAIKALGE